MHPEPTERDDSEAVRRANDAFYESFEARDVDALAAAWEKSDRVVCTHPGWPILRGWAAVFDSWARILTGPQRLQFILTNVDVQVAGNAAWVTLDENLLDGTAGGGTVAALNVFVRVGDRWLMVAHHGSGVMVQLSR